MTKKIKVNVLRIEISFFNWLSPNSAREMRREVVEMEGWRKKDFLTKDGDLDKDWARGIILGMCDMTAKEFDSYDYFVDNVTEYQRIYLQNHYTVEDTEEESKDETEEAEPYYTDGEFLIEIDRETATFKVIGRVKDFDPDKKE